MCDQGTLKRCWCREPDQCIGRSWAAKHELEVLKEGAWIEPALAFLLKKTKGVLTEKHRNVAREIFLEGGWTQKRQFDTRWSDVSKCQACKMEESTEKHRLLPLSTMARSRRNLQKVGAKSENVERVEVAKRYRCALSQ